MYVTYMYMCRYKLPVSCLNWYRIIIKVTFRSMEQVKCLTPRQSFSQSTTRRAVGGNMGHNEIDAGQSSCTRRRSAQV